MHKSSRWLNDGEAGERVIRIEAPENTSPQELYIKSNDNTIYFYADVHTISCAETNRLLAELDLKLQYMKTQFGNDFTPTIHLRVNSNGGSLFDGIAVMDRIRTLKSQVYTYVEGGAASAATLITVVGKKRFIGKHSMMLIHQLSSFNQGNFEQLEDEQANNRRLMNVIKDVYKTYTKLPMKKLDEILKRDLWLTAQECLEFGLVDEIL